MALISAHEALSLVLAETPPPTVVSAALGAARGAILAEDIHATEDVPSFDRAMMDGYALRLAQAGTSQRLAGTIRAGDGAYYEEPADGVFAIMTGAPCPAFCQAVVPIEEVSREGESLRLPAAVKPGQHIAPSGSECARGTRVLARGARLTPPAIAALATLGIERVALYSPPQLAVITTGDELAHDVRPLARGQIRDANGPLLTAMIQAAELPQSSLTSANDTKEALLGAIEAQREAAILVLSGGVSMGGFDLVPQTLRELGAEIIFHQVAQKPGKPLLFAKRGGQLIFGLPGTPLGTAFSFHRYVAAAARQLMGLRAMRPTHSGALTKPLIVRGERQCYFPAFGAPDAPGAFVLTPLLGCGSSDVFSWVAANAWLDAGLGSREFAPGECLSFDWMDGHDDLDTPG